MHVKESTCKAGREDQAAAVGVVPYAHREACPGSGIAVEDDENGRGGEIHAGVEDARCLPGFPCQDSRAASMFSPVPSKH